jgi:hypothetical protein
MFNVINEFHFLEPLERSNYKSVLINNINITAEYTAKLSCHHSANII